MSSHVVPGSPEQNTCRSFWTSRTTIERILIGTIVICLTLLTIALALTLIISLVGETKCSTSSCIKSSTRLNDYMDSSVDPCDNFYDFVCGNFVKRHGEQAASTPIYEQLRRTQLQLDRIILDDPAVKKSLKYKTPLAKNYSEPNSLALIKQLYVSCMDERKIGNDQDKVIFDLVEELGGWPIILRDFWDKDKFTWLDITVKARSLGLRFDWFIDITVKRQNNKLLAEIKPPEDLKKVDTHLIVYFLQLMIDTTSHFKAYWSRVSQLEMSKALRFEEELLQLVESTKDINYYITREVEEKYNLSEVVNAITHKNIEFYIEPRSVAYFNKLQILLSKTGKRVQANYFIWKTIYSLWPFLSRPIRDKFEVYFLLEKKRKMFRSEMCLKIVNRGLPHVIESEYVRRYVDSPLKKRIQFVIEHIKSGMIQSIEEKNWIDEHTKITAKDRIANVKSVIGGPDRMFDSRSFDQYLGLDKFVFQSDNVVHMITQLRLHMFSTNFSTAYQNDEGWWDSTNLDWATLDGRCYMQLNRLLLQASMIQDEYYSENRPQYLNFGALGTAVSSALSYYNLDPKNETYFSWITDEASREDYNKQIRCLTKHNSLSSDETLAEFMGIDVAYRAYKTAMTVLREDQQLTGHSYTPNQMFWIQAASFMCYKDIFSVTNSSTKEPKSFRILGPLRTSRYFASDFYCPVYSNMNPLEKCDW